MRTSLDHLPDAKREELGKVLEILFRGFEKATRNKSGRKQGQVLKVVLYGSYARGDWVDDPKSGYRSDYDLLVVVSSDELTDVAEYWAETDEKLLQAYPRPRGADSAVAFWKKLFPETWRVARRSNMRPRAYAVNSPL